MQYTRRQKFFGVVLAVTLLVVVAAVTALRSKSVTAPKETEHGAAPSTEEELAIPIPFGEISGNAFAGSVVNVGKKNTITIRQISFDSDEEFETIEGSAGADHIDFVLIPDSPTITTAAQLSASLKGKVYGYEYTSRSGQIENDRAKQAGLAFKDKFPGRFFSSFHDASITQFETANGITMLPIESLQLKKNARYIIVTTGPNVTFRARNVPSPLKNNLHPLDVDNDRMISNSDFNRITEYLNNPSTPKVVTSSMPAPPYYDTTGDWNISTLDALAISNYRGVSGNIFCGNGVLETMNGEQCDDNNTVNSDGCTNLCKSNNSPLYNAAKPADVNKDGYVGIFDAIKIRNYLNSPYSKTVTSDMSGPPYYDTNSDWTISPQDALVVSNYNNPTNLFCGNKRVEANNGEVCDDGNEVDEDSCSNLCKKNPSPLQNISNALDVNNDGAIGQIDAKVIIDYLNTANPKNVTIDMSAPPYLDADGDWAIAPADVQRIVNNNKAANLFCGNGVLQSANKEECDDGNEVNDDICRNDCTLTANPF